MYYQIFNIHNEPIGKIIANNDNDARLITRKLYPKYAAIHEISHKKFHYKPSLLLRVLDAITTLPMPAQAIIALIITTILFYFVEPASASATTLPFVSLGLDQWLYKKSYVKSWNHDTREIVISLSGEKAANIKPERIAYITEEIMYWRKANQIHAYFMQNEEEDNSQDINISSDRLTDLHARCVRIINECPLEDGIINNGKSLVNGEWVHNTEPGKIMTNQELAQQLLPTQDGFFFGSTDYNQWYMEDIVSTKEMLDELFKDERWDHATYTYSPSW